MPTQMQTHTSKDTLHIPVLKYEPKSYSTVIQNWVPEMFGQCSQAQVVFFGVSCTGPGVGLDILMAPFQPSMILWFYYSFCMQ